jgi:hypothetical protein
MPIQVLPAQRQLGTGLGSGVSNALHQLAQDKIGAIRQRHEHAQKTQALSQLGMDPVIAAGIAGLPEHMGQSALEEYLGQYGVGGQGEGSKARALRAQEEAATAKESHKDLESILNEGKAAEAADKRIGRMEQLISEGNLPNPRLKRYFEHLSTSEGGIGKTLGGIIGSLAGFAFGGATARTPAGAYAGAAGGGYIGSKLGETITGGISRAIGGLGQEVQRNPATEEFEKLSADFIRDAKAIFGSRITDVDLQSFVKMIPNLMQTDEGKLAVIRNMRNANRLSALRAETAKGIIKANGGRRPPNLRMMVDEMTSDFADQLAQEFKAAIPTAQ